MVQRGGHRGNFKRGRGRGGRGGRNNRGRGNFRGNNRHGNNSNPKANECLFKPEQLAETEVGITEYISTLEGFSAVLKSRYSDFQVNEIDLDGSVAQLTDTSMPKEFQVVKVEVPDKSPIKEATDEQWQEIKTLVESGDDTQSIRIDVTNSDKESRSLIHRTLKSMFHAKIISNTLDVDDKKYIELKRQIGQNKPDRPNEWPPQVPIYTHFLLYKECVDTMNAIMSIGEALRMNSTAFNYAGVKDRRAKTTQWISCKRLEPSKLLFRTKKLRNIKIGNVTFKETPLALGQLKGNLFRLALREVKVDDEIINAHLEQLKEHGFINYYGLQRFGNDKTVPTYQIGVKLLQGKFREACKLILKPKNYDNPLAEMTEAKKIYDETEDARKAVKMLTTNQSIEAKLLHGLAESGKNDFVNALESIPRNMRLMYIHAFQSLIWNQVVSKRIKDFGMKPIVGDLVYDTEQEEMELLLDDVKGVKDSDATEEHPEKTETKESEAANDEEKKDKKRLVKILTEEDLPNYTIYDVVMPMPGYDITYPEYMKEYYKELLGKYELELEMPQQRVKSYTLSGTYRRIVSKAEELAWNIIKYKHPHDNLILSDFEKILKHKEPESAPDGEFKAIVMSFKLKSSSYATMVVREVIKIDTSAQNQSKLNAPAQNATTEPENSLLGDKSKFAAFKKLIEEGGSDEEIVTMPVKRPAEDETAAGGKKVKLDDDEEEESGIKMQASLV